MSEADTANIPSAREHDRLVDMQRRHDSDMRRGSIGTKTAILFGLEIDQVGKFSVSRFTSYPGSPAMVDRLPIDLIALNVHALFDPEEGYEERVIVVAEMVYSEGASFCFSAIKDSPLTRDELWEVVRMQQEVDSLLPPIPTQTLPTE